MKKVFLSLALCAVAFAASAQLKSVDAKMDYRWKTGFGVGATIGLGEAIEIAPSVSYFFPGDHWTMWEADVNAHYILPFEIHENLDLYPVAGLGLFHIGYDYDDFGLDDDYSYNKLLINVGAGARWHFNDQWAAFTEEKYQIVDGYDENYFTVGISFKF